MCRRNINCCLPLLSTELCSRQPREISNDCTVPNTGSGSSSSASRIRSLQAARESSQKMRIQLKAVTKTAITHDPMPHASPITTTMMALPVSFGLSSAVRKRSSAPMPKMTTPTRCATPLCRRSPSRTFGGEWRAASQFMDSVWYNNMIGR